MRNMGEERERAMNQNAARRTRMSRRGCGNTREQGEQEEGRSSEEPMKEGSRTGDRRRT